MNGYEEVSVGPVCVVHSCLQIEMESIVSRERGAAATQYRPVIGSACQEDAHSLTFQQRLHAQRHVQVGILLHNPVSSGANLVSPVARIEHNNHGALIRTHQGG